MLTAVVAFSGMDTLLKILSATYPPMQVLMLRGATSLPFMLLPVLATGALAFDLRPRRLSMHLMRGSLSVVMLGGFIYRGARAVPGQRLRGVPVGPADRHGTLGPAPQGAHRPGQLGGDRCRACRGPHHAAPERLGDCHAWGARGTGLGACLRGQCHHAARAHSHRHDRSVVVWTIRRDDRVSPPSSPPRTGWRFTRSTTTGCWCSGPSRPSARTCSPRRSALRLPQSSHRWSTRRCCGAW